MVEVDNGGEEWSIEDRRGPARWCFSLAASAPVGAPSLFGN